MSISDTERAFADKTEGMGPGDFLDLDALLTEDERSVRDEVRVFVREKIKPNIAEWYEKAIFPPEIVNVLPSLLMT